MNATVTIMLCSWKPFTKHPTVPIDFSTVIPTWKVILWFGFHATYGVGLILGIILCGCAFLGKWKRLPLTELLAIITAFIPINLFLSFFMVVLLSYADQSDKRTKYDDHLP